MPTRIFFVFFLICSLSTSASVFASEQQSPDAESWSKSLSFDGGGVWKLRIPVRFENKTDTAWEGRPTAVRLSDAIQAPKAQEVRVTKSDGQEVLFNVLHADGMPLESGLMPENAFIMIPVDCEPGKTAKYFIYYGNEKAEALPEFLNAKQGLVNTDLEIGLGSIPDGWYADQNTETMQNAWVDENPKTGKRCLQTTIKDGEKPSWFAIRQSGIPVIGGLKYRFSAWVRGENVKGRAGWYIHVGNEKKSDIINNVQGNYDGSFDWKEIEIEFTAPKEANRMTVGTVLYGTGSAWYDSVCLECLDKEHDIESAVGDLEFIPYKIFEADLSWPTTEKGNYLCRSKFRIVNDSEKPLENVPVLMTLRGTAAHGLRGPLKNLFAVQGTGEDNKKHSVQLLDADQNRVVAKLSIPEKSVKYFNVYYQLDEAKAPTGLNLKKADLGTEADTAHPELQAAQDPFAGLPNLVKNGDFEQNEGDHPTNWRRNDPNPPKGVQYAVETSPEIVRFGKSCARLDVAENAPKSWRGWTQSVKVEPGKSYLVQGWLRGKDIESARLHLHFHDEKGSLAKDNAMSSVGPDISGTTDWTRLAEVVTTPNDARTMTVHLTTNSSGTLWHDNISVFDGLFAEQIDRESNYPLKSEFNNLMLWQVPAVVKVFPQTIPSKTAISAIKPVLKIESAKNEKEPIQIAVRSDKNLPLTFTVSAPVHSKGFKLDDFEINTVGYVPVNYPTNYYNTKVPAWYQKTPTSAPGCDGWKGIWPDPLLPDNTLQLKPNRTESVWITFSIPKDAPAGKYSGNLTVSSGFAPKLYPIEIIVRNFALPDENHVSAIYDVRFGPGAKYWGKAVRDYYREIVDLMSENRLAPDSVGVEPNVVLKDGKLLFDWAEFDETCNWYFNERKIRFAYTPNTLYSFGWGHPPRKFFGENPYPGEWPFKDADFSKINPEYKKLYQDYLRQFWTHVKEKGWADRFVLYISDEPNFWTGNIIGQMQAVCKMIHEVDPSIPIYSSTWHYLPQWKDAIDVWGIAHYGLVPVDKMQEIKDYGSKIWFTTDGMLCLDTPYSAIERLLPYYCFKYGADAYEFWGVGWLTYNPYQYGSHAYIHQTSTPGEYYWVRYPNGDGYMIYPPEPIGAKKIVQSIRFAQAREGVEDFEYFYMLSNLIDQAKTTGKDVSKAENALKAARDMVDCPSPTGRYSSKILPNPDRIYETRRQVADAIEQLQTPEK